jgi:hypothetical protein
MIPIIPEGSEYADSMEREAPPKLSGNFSTSIMNLPIAPGSTSAYSSKKRIQK